MAVVFLFRAAILLTPTLVRLVQSPQPPAGQQALTIGKAMWDRLTDPGESDEGLSDALSSQMGYSVVVATYSDPFTLRKLQVRWGRISGAAGGADDAVTTHHFLRVISGAPSGTWVAADFLAVEAAFNTFWGTWKGYCNSNLTLKQYRWYKAGPQDGPPQIPARIVDVNVAGTGTAAPGLPPQCAVSVTEKTSDPKSWGRFYLPPPNAINGVTATGRLITATQTALANAVDTLYEAFYSAGTVPVVYSIAKPTRETKAGAELPAAAARALTVGQIQIDDVLDVIRSRRWNEPLLREQRDIAGS